MWLDLLDVDAHVGVERVQLVDRCGIRDVAEAIHLVSLLEGVQQAISK